MVAPSTEVVASLRLLGGACSSKTSLSWVTARVAVPLTATMTGRRFGVDGIHAPFLFLDKLSPPKVAAVAKSRSRSSVTNRLAALTEIGGVNSIRSFTRSWQRAAGFAEVIPQRPSFVFAPDQAPIGGHEAPIQYGRSDVETGQLPRTSLLRQHFEASLPDHPAIVGDDAEAGASHDQDQDLPPDSQPPDNTDFREREQKALDNELLRAFQVGSGTTSTSIFAIPPHLATPPIIGSLGSYRTYGTIRSDISQQSMAQAGAMWRQQQEAGGNVPDGEVEPILVKEVEQDGKIVLTVEGQSTLPQTVFNSTKCVSDPTPESDTRHIVANSVNS